MQVNSTLTPDDEGAGAPDDPRGPLPVLRILFHPELDRIGATTDPGLFFPDQPLTIGRVTPEFSSRAGQVEPLTDPCVSREQLRITWTARANFTVESLGARPVELFDLDGTPRSLDEPVPAQTMIAIGNRVLLLLTLRPGPPSNDSLGLVGESEALFALRRQIRNASRSNSTVLIQGESGVGKELVAQAIHLRSQRRDCPRLVVNCAAIPENLLESELFGHVRGAFTGADADKEGLFRAAGRGTLFLDEIGDLPLALQAKLLRVLQERMVRPVGAVEEQPVNARVIAATNRDLQREAAEGRFREDLYYRLAALTIDVTPLRQRREDVPLLFRHFLRQCSGDHPELERLWSPVSQATPPVPMELMQRLLVFHWPGNVRHLRNVVERLAVSNLRSETFTMPRELAQELERASTPSEPVDRAAASAVEAGSQPGSLEGIDDRQLLALLEEHDYIQSRVAQAVGVSHTTIDRRMRKLGLKRPRDLSQQELEDAAQQTGSDLVAMARLLKVSRRGIKLRAAALGIVLEG
jgi:two-component system nitrogen regulation response regulator GlnG